LKLGVDGSYPFQHKKYTRFPLKTHSVPTSADITNDPATFFLNGPSCMICVTKRGERATNVNFPANDEFEAISMLPENTKLGGGGGGGSLANTIAIEIGGARFDAFGA